MARRSLAFVWWGVPRPARSWLEIRILAFVVVALFCCTVLDSARALVQTPRPGAAQSGQPVPQRRLELQISGDVSPDKYSLSLYVRRPEAKGDYSYEKARYVETRWGAATVLQLPEGSYLLVVEAAQVARHVERVDLRADKQLVLTLTAGVRRTIKVLAGQDDALRPLKGATVLLSDTAPQAGTAVLSSSAAQAGIAVQASTAAHLGGVPFGGSTDALGVLTFEGVPPVPLLLRIFAPGFQPYRATIEGDLTVRLEPATSLEVSVVDGGVPEAGAEVVLSGPNLWPPQSVTTKQSGRVTVTGLASGRYVLFARKGERISALNDRVHIDETLGVSRVQLELNAGSFLSARIVSGQDQKPISDAKVSVSAGALGSLVLYEHSGPDGRVRVGPLLSAQGVLSARAPGYVGVTRAFPEPAAPGTTPSAELLVELVRAGTIVGRVVDERGFPVPMATLEAVGTGPDHMPYSVTYNSAAVNDAHFKWAEDWAADLGRALIPAGELGVMLGPVPPIPLGDMPSLPGPRSLQNLTSDDKGYFTISGVPPGPGLVLGRHPDFLDGKSAPVQVVPGGEHTVEVVLRSGQPVLGRVLDHRGFPVSGAIITLTAADFERRVVSESDGNFTVGAAPARVSLRIHDPDNPLSVVHALELDPKQRAEKLLIELPPPRADCDLQVTDASGAALALAQVTVSSLEPSVPLRQTRFTQDDGVAQLMAVAGLKANVEVSAAGFVSKSLTLRLGAREQVQLVRSLSAHGMVTGVRGRQPAARAIVEFESGAVRRLATADELGNYLLTGLPPGRGHIRGRHPDYGQASMSVLVQPGVGDRPLELPTLDLVPSLHITGRVEDERGAAVSGALVSSERVSAYLSSRTAPLVLTQSDEAGAFEVDVERAAELYLYAAEPGAAFGFSDRLEPTERDAMDDVVIVLDRVDEAPTAEPATVLVSLEERDGDLIIYAVARGSLAERAGLRAEDTLVSIMGERPSDCAHARTLLSGSLGGPLSVEVTRGGRELSFLVEREGFAR